MITQKENNKVTQKEEINETKKETQPKMKPNFLKDISDLEKFPAASFHTTPGSETIEAFIEKLQKREIEYPPMQRQSVWSVTDQAELIESIIKGIPIPPIYMNRIIRDSKEVWEILDGRQRITALQDFFIGNTVQINSNLPKGYSGLEKYTYKEIEEANPKFAGKFTSIPLPVVWMNDASDELKTEFFQKLNKGGKALTIGELAHSSLVPAIEYIADLMKVEFYDNHVSKTKRYAECVPVSKVLHFILMAKQKDNTFVYNPLILNGWKDRIITNPVNRQTDLDNMSEVRNEEFIPYWQAEVERVCELTDEIFGGLIIKNPNNQLLTNMLISLLILEDKCNPQAMDHEELKTAYNDLVKVWDIGHEPKLRKKMKTQMCNITQDESAIITECDKLQSDAKDTLAEVLENIRNNVYSNYI